MSLFQTVEDRIMKQLKTNLSLGHLPVLSSKIAFRQAALLLCFDKKACFIARFTLRSYMLEMRSSASFVWRLKKHELIKRIAVKWLDRYRYSFKNFNN